MQGRSDRGKAGYPMCLLFWRFARIFQASPIQEPACSWRRKMGNSWPQMEDKPPLCFGWAPLSLPTPSLQWKTTSGQTDRKPSMKVPKREAPRLFGGGTVFLRENHPHNHHDSYHERATWNWYQKQHYKDSLSLVLRRPTATAPGADSELFFLIDFSATTYPGPKPCLSPWLAGWHTPRAWCCPGYTARRGWCPTALLQHEQMAVTQSRRNTSPELSRHRWKCFAVIFFGNKHTYSGYVCSLIQTTNLRSQTLC